MPGSQHIKGAPAKVNEIYEALRRKGHSKTRAAKMAWATYKKSKGDSEQFEESSMTTEEALAVADAVQFDANRPPIRKKPERRSDASIKARMTHEHTDIGKAAGFNTTSTGRTEYPRMRSKLPGVNKGRANEERGLSETKRDSAERLNYRNKKKSGVTIQHAANVHFSEDAQQFAESVKQRYDAAERGAMRRAIVRANIHPAIKQALLRHADAVQFSDAGDEIPSVPMTWIVAAARGILQMAYEQFSDEDEDTITGHRRHKAKERGRKESVRRSQRYSDNSGGHADFSQFRKSHHEYHPMDKDYDTPERGYGGEPAEDVSRPSTGEYGKKAFGGGYRPRPKKNLHVQ